MIESFVSHLLLMSLPHIDAEEVCIVYGPGLFSVSLPLQPAVAYKLSTHHKASADLSSCFMSRFYGRDCKAPASIN